MITIKQLKELAIVHFMVFGATAEAHVSPVESKQLTFGIQNLQANGSVVYF